MNLRPLCACCHRPLTKHTTSLWFKQGDEPANREDAQRRTNLAVVSINRLKDRKIISVGVWDGESYGLNGRGIFCTHHCAEAFGWSSYQAGYRIEQPMRHPVKRQR